MIPAITGLKKKRHDDKGIKKIWNSWFFRLVSFGVGLSYFGTISQQNGSFGTLIGFAIGFGIFGGIIGLIIDFVKKSPTLKSNKEQNSASGAPVNINKPIRKTKKVTLPTNKNSSLNEQKEPIEMSLHTITEDDIYTQIAEEMERNEIKSGLWTKATAFAEGEPEKIKSLYIKYRFQSIQEEILKKEEDKARKEQEVLKKQAEAARSELEKDKEKFITLSEIEKQKILKEVSLIEDKFLISIKDISKNTKLGSAYMHLFDITYKDSWWDSRFEHPVIGQGIRFDRMIEQVLEKMNGITKLKVLKKAQKIQDTINLER
mgnify:CR=1 FL=1